MPTTPQTTLQFLQSPCQSVQRAVAGRLCCVRDPIMLGSYICCARFADSSTAKTGEPGLSR
eukprot:4910568-Karenia_brevis.AAC.1